MGAPNKCLSYKCLNEQELSVGVGKDRSLENRESKVNVVAAPYMGEISPLEVYFYVIKFISSY